MLTLREIQRVPEKHAGPVTIGGWAKTIRTGKSVGFIELNDGTCFKSVQVLRAGHGPAGADSGCPPAL